MQTLTQSIKIQIGSQLLNFVQEALDKKDTVSKGQNSNAKNQPKLDDIINQIRHHKDPKEGDYQLNIRCFNRYRILEKGKEAGLAQTWAEKLSKDTGEFIQEISANQGFITIKLDPVKVTQAVLAEVIKKGDQYGTSIKVPSKTVLIEYSSPNIAKPFHIGHLRSTIIGNFLKNLYQVFGYQTVSVNYLGDWGKQYGLLAIAYQKWGSEEKLEEDPIQHLYELYVQVNKALKEEREKLGIDRTPLDLEAQLYFRKMEEGKTENSSESRKLDSLNSTKDSFRTFEVLELWARLRKLSIKSYEKTYRRLGVQFDVYSGESQVASDEEGSPHHTVIKVLKNTGLVQSDEKGQFIDLEKHKLGHAVIYKSDGTTLYLTRDLAEVYRRYETYNFEKCLYVVGDPQQHHFKQFFKLVELMGLECAGRCQHVGFGKVIGMSTRKGDAIFLNEILDTAKAKMLTVMQENEEKMQEIDDPEWTADQLGISAVIIQDFSAKRGENYHFDWDRMTSFKGETGPYLQYAHARVSSIFRKVVDQVSLNKEADLSLLVEPEAYLLVKEIGKYQEVLEKCLDTLEPLYLVAYLMDLSKAIATAHISLRVKDMEKPLAESRLLLFWAAKTVLASGLKILGLTPIEAM